MKKSPRVCVIGAGCSGITAVKNLIQAGVKEVVCYEKGDQIGGNWVYSDQLSHSSVCETTHIISSKKLSEFLDFPMPEEYPDYPSHSQVLEYFRDYVRHFGIEDYIQFNTEVLHAKPVKNGWEVNLNPGGTEFFDYLLVANGHHAKPRYPDFAGEFSGDFLHSHDYKHNRDERFIGKRVLVIGAGNSGCDCAVEISRVAKKVDISMRRGYYIIPKFFMGKPTDSYNKTLLKLPKFIAGFFRKLTVKFVVGNYKDYGLENPDYSVLKCHPVVNSELLYRIRHGKVKARKDVERLEAKKVYFKDGTSGEYDTIVAATGYYISFPFLDSALIDFSDAERIPLYLRIFHPEFPSLFFIGLVQPQGCVWPLSDLQSKLVGNHLMGRWNLPSNLQALAEKDAEAISKNFIKSARHTIEVHYHEYAKHLQREIPKNAPVWNSLVSTTQQENNYLG